MTSKPILITGASGLLGGALTAEYEAMGLPVIPLYGTAAADLTDPQVVEVLMERHRPAAVIHCAALTDVDYCELHPPAAWQTNVEVTGQVAACCTVFGARFAYISTDAVFDGSHGNWRETDSPSPCNIYARSKLEGENAARRECPGALILRTNIYGWHTHRKPSRKPSLAEWILERLEAGLEVPGFTDVLFSPILVNHLAAPILDLLRDGYTGIFHLGGSWSGSKYEFACRLAETFEFDRSEILPAKLEGASLQATRPLDTSLDIRKVSRVLNTRTPGLDEGLRRFRILRTSKELAYA